MTARANMIFLASLSIYAHTYMYALCPHILTCAHSQNILFKINCITVALKWMHAFSIMILASRWCSYMHTHTCTCAVWTPRMHTTKTAYVHIFLGTYTEIHVCIYAWTHTHKYMCTYAWTHTHKYICAWHIHTNTYVHICLNTYTQIHMCVTRTHKYICAHMLEQIHTNTYVLDTYTQIHSLGVHICLNTYTQIHTCVYASTYACTMYGCAYTCTRPCYNASHAIYKHTHTHAHTWASYLASCVIHTHSCSPAKTKQIHECSYLCLSVYLRYLSIHPCS